MVIDRREQIEQCVEEYINGVSKKVLAKKYSVSERTINKWIEKSNIGYMEKRLASRAQHIPIEVQKEVLDVLNTNAMLYGFDTNIWSDKNVVRYIKDTYNINITKGIANKLIVDSYDICTVKNEEQIYKDIEKLNNLGYSTVLLDFVRFGKIAVSPVQPLGYIEKDIEYYSNPKNKINVYLIIGRANDTIYVGKIMTKEVMDVNGNVTCKDEKININKQKKAFLDKVHKYENKEVIFISSKRYGNRIPGYKFLLIDDYIYDDLVQSNYETNEKIDEYGKVVEYDESIVKYIERKVKNNIYKDLVTIPNINRIINNYFTKYIKSGENYYKKSRNTVKLLNTIY